ncbi:Uncharacterised protein [Mycobacteroides abscessus subsp. massiliense]|nr:Uncharacterised protein [Mycobacteroides abscessus subsp. massiliense]
MTWCWPRNATIGRPTPRPAPATSSGKAIVIGERYTTSKMTPTSPAHATNKIRIESLIETSSSFTTADGPVRCAVMPLGGGYWAISSRICAVDSMARAVPILPLRLIRT